MGKFDFNTQQIIEVNSNILVANEDINNYLSLIKEECSLLSSNLRSTDYNINSKLQEITDSINRITNTLTTRVFELNEQLGAHISKYEELVIEATALLREALEFIKDNFVTNNTSIGEETNIYGV